MKAIVLTLPDWLRTRFTDAQRFMILCILAGLFCGLAAVAFHWSIHGLFHVLWELAEWLIHHNLAALVPLIPAAGGFLSGYLMWRFAPGAVGSGIPQTKAAFYNNFGVMKLKDAAWRFVLGTVYVGSGNPLGREGPTVHMCAAIASKLGQWSGLAKARIQGMVPVGMAAGIAAAFNAPLSAILFVFEELLDDFSTKALAGIVVAVVIAAAVSRMLLGEEPVLHVDLGDGLVTAWWMLVAIPLGIISAFAGNAFVKLILSARSVVRERKGLAPWVPSTLGGLLSGIIGMAAYYWTAHYGEPQNAVFSIGYNGLEAAFDYRIIGVTMAILLVLKFVAVVVAYASGGSGGLFSPTLFLGGMLGGLLGEGLTGINEYVAIFRGASDASVVGACVLLGMGAMFASIVRCPFTSLVIIFEMTRDYSLILPLMAGNMIAYYLATQLQRVPLYNSLLLQDGINLRRMPAYQGLQDYRNLPVSTIMTYECVTVAAEQNAAQALESLNERGLKHHGYPVMAAGGKLVGMVMHHELEEHMAQGIETSLGESLSKQQVIHVNPETSIRQAANVLIKADVLQMPVVSATDATRLLGILTLHDIARQQNAVSEQLGR